LRILCGDVVGKGDFSEASGPRRVGEAAAPAAVAAGGGDLPRFLRTVDVGNEDAGRAAIEHREDVGFARIADPHDAGDVGCACGQHHDVDGAAIDGRVLLVDND